VKVGVIGFGQIGRGVVDSINKGEAGDTELAAILVRDKAKAAAAGAREDLLTDDVDGFLASDLDIIVELGGHDALRQYAIQVLDAGKDLLTLSVGAFADEALLNGVTEAARRNGRRVLVPSGAIAGLDMITAAALRPIDRATHTTRKNPRAFTEEQLGGQKPDKEALLLFEGPARQGVGKFPENVNVAAAVSISGIGLDRTILRVYADPNVERNTHEVVVEGYFGRVRIDVENIPSENPKTGRIVALSVVKALRNQTAPFVIGL
jgi:aspartate dehydrogenase